jgi:hypothetical protein
MTVQEAINKIEEESSIFHATSIAYRLSKVFGDRGSWISGGLDHEVLVQLIRKATNYDCI